MDAKRTTGAKPARTRGKRLGSEICSESGGAARFAHKAPPELSGPLRSPSAAENW